jgi:hypothetical protein
LAKSLLSLDAVGYQSPEEIAAAAAAAAKLGKPLE